MTSRESFELVKAFVENEAPDNKELKKAVEEFEAALDMNCIFRERLFFKRDGDKLYITEKTKSVEEQTGNKVAIPICSHEANLVFRFLNRDRAIIKKRQSEGE